MTMNGSKVMKVASWLRQVVRTWRFPSPTGPQTLLAVANGTPADDRLETIAPHEPTTESNDESTLYKFDESSQEFEEDSTTTASTGASERRVFVASMSYGVTPEMLRQHMNPGMAYVCGHVVIHESRDILHSWESDKKFGLQTY